MRILWTLVIGVLLLGLTTAALAQGGREIRFRVVSNSRDYSLHVEFWRDHSRFYYSDWRGFIVAALDPATGELLSDVGRFDTWGTSETGEQMRRMIAHLNTQPNGTLFLLAVCDEAGLNRWDRCDFYDYPWVTDALLTLEALGSTTIRSYCYRYSWAMIALKGDGYALTEAVGSYVRQPVSVETTIVLPVEPTTWGQIKATFSAD
ncbi:MAG: hypothetical protein HY340_04120 [Candidatus Kerfeldbacteria bacterium]|nr:hypothetical protein [Candidatus Kerfeldbacteria bacterium]